MVDGVMKNLLQEIIMTGLMIGMLTGCGSLPTQPHRSHTVSPPAQTLTFNSRQQTDLYQRLEQQYHHWKGTPYRLGGMNRNGIDCSGFVHVAFRDGLGMKIPRTTKRLAARGKPVAKHHLDIGDLVFFKTGFGKRHVGIYIGNQQFIHASTSNGVVKSSLNNPYWAEHYWKSARLIAN
jgi:cell wall-associated NlpC family hydrolase